MGARQQGADAVAGRWLVIPRTLCFVRHGEDVLLMKRAPHRRVFPNKYNGLGGHVERDEDLYQAAQREILEESGLSVGRLQLCAVHNIDAHQNTGIILFVFVGWSNSRDVRNDGREGTLEWVPVRDVLSYDLVEDLPEVLPRALAMQAQTPVVYAHVTYDDADEIVMRYSEGI